MELSKESILIVDDDSDVLQALNEELSEHFDVTPLLSGEQALARLAAQSFSAIISDVQMPGIDGLTLIKECARRYPDMVRLILTAFDGEDVQDVALSQAGAYKLIKPWGDDLIVTLKNALAQRKTTMDLQKSIDLNAGAVDLDLRLHLRMKPEEVIPGVITELLRVPGVLDVTYYRFGEDGPCGEPQQFGAYGKRGPARLIRHQMTSPEPDEQQFIYGVPLGNWPTPVAAFMCRLTNDSLENISYLDFVGRQGYRTLALVGGERVGRQSTIREPKPSIIPGEDGNSATHWLIKELAMPGTVIVSAVQTARQLASAKVETPHKRLLTELAEDLETAAASINATINNLKKMN